MCNVKVADKQKVMTDASIAKAVAAHEKEMAGRGRVLLRPSGTEPVVRVMVEGDDASDVKSRAETLASVVASVAG